MKKLLTQDIKQVLQEMGFRLDFSGDADIYVNELMKIVGQSTRAYEVEFTLGIALDVKGRNLLYYEKIVERDTGFAKGDMESNFNNESTRRVSKQGNREFVRVQTNEKGEIVEMRYDFSEVQKRIKNVCIKYGLKLRPVLSMRKINALSRQELEEDLANLPDCVRVNTTNAEGTHINTTLEQTTQPLNRNLSRRGRGFLFMLLWSFNLVFYLLISLGSATMGIGVLIIVAMHVFVMMFYFGSTKRRWWAGVLWVVLLFVISFFIFSFTTPF